LLLLTAIYVCFTLVVLAVRLGEAVPPGSWWFPLCLFAIAAAFFCTCWVRGGQTLGMRAWRIRVVRDDGRAVTYAQAITRFGAGLAAFVPAGLGLWWSLFDGAKRGWHDRWTGTRVVRAQPPGPR
jgi:uncharacterized RDD family membrane protein YckC